MSLFTMPPFCVFRFFHAREGSHVGGDLGSNEEVRDWINGLKKRFPPGHPKELSLWI